MKAGFWSCIRRILFIFDAESAHRLAVVFLRFSSVFLGRVFLRQVSGAGRIQAGDALECWGLRFPNRVGLAAGFDKDAELVDILPSLGFGFAEIGTVTPRAQSGNPRPRLFRDAEGQRIFNRMGFNNAGASEVSRRLERVRPRLKGFPIGVNLGKNKDTSLERAHEDYLQALIPFEGLADYLVINVSSPNTPGLRDLQTTEALDPIVRAVVQKCSSWSARPPVLLKLAPELGTQELQALASKAQAWGLSGWVLTNTLAGEGVLAGQKLSGGWSGEVLRESSRTVLLEMRKLSDLPVISVGGILIPEEARERIRLGASLVQVYSGWVFSGPEFPARVVEGIRGA